MCISITDLNLSAVHRIAEASHVGMEREDVVEKENGLKRGADKRGVRRETCEGGGAVEERVAGTKVSIFVAWVAHDYLIYD